MPDMPSNLIDGQRLSNEHPDTFHVPSTIEIDQIDVGDYVKIGLEDPEGIGERFWVKVNEVRPNTFTGSVENDLELFPEYPYKCIVGFERRHVLSLVG